MKRAKACILLICAMMLCACGKGNTNPETTVSGQETEAVSVETDKEDTEETPASSEINTNVEGAEEVYQNFLSATEIMKTDPSWDYTLNTLYGRNMRESYKNNYLRNVQGATEDKWNALSNYEVFVYIETYLRYADSVGAQIGYLQGGEDDIESWEKNIIGNFNGTDSEKVIEAYDDVVRWQAQYWESYLFPYNMITKRSYADEIGTTTKDTNLENYVDIWNTGSIDIESMENLPDMFYKECEFSVCGEGEMESIIETTVIRENAFWWSKMITDHDTYAMPENSGIMSSSLNTCTEIDLSGTKVFRCEGYITAWDYSGTKEKKVCRFVLFCKIDDETLKTIIFGDRSRNPEDFIKTKEAADAIMATYRPIQ